jgi:Protein of unknown function (DUF2971)
MVSCPNCEVRAEYTLSAIKTAAFDGTRFAFLPLNGIPNSRNDTILALQMFGALKTGLFKYVVPQRIDVLKKELIRFTPLSQCNDYAEGLPLLDDSAVESLVREKAREAAALLLDLPGFQFVSPDGGGPKALEDYMIETKRALGTMTIDFTFREQVGILSMTTNPLSPVMWAHYANNHQGFVIRFEVGDLIPANSGYHWELGRAWPVIYSDRRHNAASLDAAALLYEKSAEWSYETEWRIGQMLDDAHVLNAPHVHLFRMPATSISGIILGAHSNSDLREEVVSLGERDPRFGHLKVEQLSIASNGELRITTLRPGHPQNRTGSSGTDRRPPLFTNGIERFKSRRGKKPLYPKGPPDSSL